MWTRTITAYNDAVASENRIHSDDVARQYGFAGGLVPGVTVYRYLAGPVLDAFGVDWVAGGTMAARFSRPVYDGDTVVTTAVPDGEGGDSLVLELRDSGGEVCATGTATRQGAGTPPLVDAYPAVALPAPGERAPASPDAFAAWPVLGELRFGFHLEHAGPDDAVFGVAHPAWLLRSANFVLSSTVRLGPWIHASSAAENFSAVRDGETVSVRARVADVFERSGHRFVELDVAWIADDERVAMHARHTAIYEPRPVAARP
jgi:acyl dehydratase